MGKRWMGVSCVNGTGVSGFNGSANKTPHEEQRKFRGHYCISVFGTNFIDNCAELNNGKFEICINGGEYRDYVNFCPICGKKATTNKDDIDKEEEKLLKEISKDFDSEAEFNKAMKKYK